MDSTGKKSVRFSAAFEEYKMRRGSANRTGGRKDESEIFSSTPKQESFRSHPSSFQNSNMDNSLDSWDAFDAKMHKSKTSISKARNKFLELSSSQNKSLQVEDSEFQSCSFQDAKDIIEKDEKERMMFMNDNVSFSDSKVEEGIDQVDPPSLLSFTSYFQQGSSFPESFLLASNPNGDEPPERLRDLESFNNQQRPSVSHHTSRRSSAKQVSFTRKDIEDENEKPHRDAKVSRKDSLTKFFLGPESDGMRREAIMDHVLEYCKRRASARLSIASTSNIDPPEMETPITTTRESTGSTYSIKTSSENDSGIEFAHDDRSTRHHKSKSPNVSEWETTKKITPRNVFDHMENEVHTKRQKHLLNIPIPPMNSSKKVETSDSTVVSTSSIQRAPQKVLPPSRNTPEPLSTATSFLNTSIRPSKIPKHQDSSRSHQQTVQFTPQQQSLKVLTPSQDNVQNSGPPQPPITNNSQSTKVITPRNVPTATTTTLSTPQCPQVAISTTQETLHQSAVTNPPPNVPTSLQLVPATSTVPQHHHMNLGNSQCACHQPHAPMTPSMVPVPGMPIVIHIHLPCTMAPAGNSMVHPVSAPSTENPK